MLSARTLTAALALTLLSPSVPAGGDIEEFDPGPHAISTVDWDFGQITVTHPFGGGATLDVNHFGTAVWPTERPGDDRGREPRSRAGRASSSALILTPR